MHMQSPSYTTAVPGAVLASFKVLYYMIYENDICKISKR